MATKKIKGQQRELEIWKPIPLVDGKYEACSKGGKIRNAKTKKVHSAHDNGNGYLKVHLSKLGNYFVHQLVLNAFIGQKPEGYECDHRDRNRYNNDLSNLRYVSRRENAKNKEDYTDCMGREMHYSRSVYMIDSVDGEIVDTYDSVSDASTNTGISYRSIHNAIKYSDTHYAKGFLWYYADELDQMTMDTEATA